MNDLSIRLSPGVGDFCSHRALNGVYFSPGAASNAALVLTSREEDSTHANEESEDRSGRYPVEEGSWRILWKLDRPFGSKAQTQAGSAHANPGSNFARGREDAGGKGANTWLCAARR